MDVTERGVVKAVSRDLGGGDGSVSRGGGIYLGVRKSVLSDSSRGRAAGERGERGRD